MKTVHVPWIAHVLTLGVIVLCNACAAPNAALQQSRQAYEQARQDPSIVSNAPSTLDKAEQALHQAEQAKDEEDVNHLAYMAERWVEIARTEAQRKTAEAEAEQKLKDRDRVVLQARAQRLEQELAELKAKKTDRGYVLTLGDVLFDYNQASLKPGAQQELYRLATFLKEHPDQKILVEGHTDSAGSESYNLDLSQRRALAVQDFLVRNGVRPEQITARGYGEAYPVTSNDTAAGRQQNRRVEVVFSGQPRPAVMLGQ
jgi:OmpA-OmpF porin, OOP family